jgi:esterase/lipase superfamily enzyme
MRRLCAMLTSSVFLLLVASCERPPELVGIVNADIPVDAVPDVTRHRLFITTTREASEALGALYSSTRSSDLGLASVVVTVPPNHVIGSLERPTSLPPDPRTEFSVIDPVVFRTDDSFIAEVNRELAQRPVGQRSLLLFVHGYNTSTSDAILRLGQFVQDSGFTGVPVLFTWASAAQLPRYVYDLNSALVARVQLKEMASILARTRAEKFDILAHSMGTFLIMEGLVDAHLSGTLGTRGQIDHIVLASPDIDIDLFRTQISILPDPILNRIYILASQDDGALRFSRRIAGGVDRVGAANAEELGKLGVTVIDLSEIEDSGSGSHSKFAGSPEVVKLIGAAFKSGATVDGPPVPTVQGLLQNVPIRIFGN